jgi:aryl-alcohol dehydrogenase-like predicted oxidoreductase
MFYVFPGSALNLTTTMTDYAISRNLTPFISMQNHYNLVYREEEREMFPTLKVGNLICGQMDWLIDFLCFKEFGVGSIPWSPLARGVLTKPVGTQTLRTGTDGCAVISRVTKVHLLMIYPQLGQFILWRWWND